MSQPVSDTPTTVAVVVTYRPDLQRLDEGLRAVLPQVDEIVIVHNGPEDHELSRVCGLHHVQALFLGANLGIATAQNRGMAWARARGASDLLLLDQDSVADPEMVVRLRMARSELRNQGVRVGAVGPAQVDAVGQAQVRFTRFERGRYRQVVPPADVLSMPCDMLIASGTLISLAVLDEVGGMDEGLFIDKVDTEWCLRASHRGWTLHGVPAARLHHRLGESTLTVRWWGGKRLPVHKPFRYYFMVRNSVLLQRRAGIRWNWRWADLTQVIQIVVFHGFLAPGARDNRRWILRGLRDGLRGVTGPMPAH